MELDSSLRYTDLAAGAERVFELAARKVWALDKAWDPHAGTPVFTVEGKYTTRGWTEWTQGFQYGCAILAYDGTDDPALLELGRENTRVLMAPHITHVGVHDHGFNNLSTYGNLRRLMLEGRIPHSAWELAFYNLAIMSSGAVQAARWADVQPLDDGVDGGFVFSFNGPHSLFIDTMRTIRIMSLAHHLGHVLMGENDRRISLLARSVTHALTSAKYSIYYGEGRDGYDVPADRGRTVHEAIFNRNDGRFRCPSSQQGYSPFSTWTRGLAWAIAGYPEELEFLAELDDPEFDEPGLPSRSDIVETYLHAAKATCDFYIDRGTAADGICYWDTGAPGMAAMPDWRDRPADPFNDHEPVDASASAIAAQGLLRLGRYLGAGAGDRYTQAGLAVAKRLFDEPYLSTDDNHQGLLLHSVYHRPNGWDHVPAGRKVPCGESSMWGDYHLLELALLVSRVAKQEAYPTFYGPIHE